MDRPGVRQVPEGSGEHGKIEKTGCKIICGAPTTLAVKGLMIMMNGTQGSRLDFFLISEQLGLDIASADITPGYCSDHSLVDIAFKTNTVKRNRRF